MTMMRQCGVYLTENEPSSVYRPNIRDQTMWGTGPTNILPL